MRVSSKMENLQERLAVMLHREAIRDVLHRYSYGMDRRDQEILATVFWPDSTVEYGMFYGSGTEFAQFIIPWFEEMRMATPCTCWVTRSSGSPEPPRWPKRIF